jgi:hypothetical protein
VLSVLDRISSWKISLSVKRGFANTQIHNPETLPLMLDVHLIPAFGKRQIRDITREELQGFLSRKLGGGLSWETVHHFKCGLSKILGAAEDWGSMAENLAQKTKLPRRQYGPQRVVLAVFQIRDRAALLDDPTCSIKARMLRVCEPGQDADRASRRPV